MSEYLYKFSETEVTTIRGALELARDKYRENAQEMRKPCDDMESAVDGARVVYDRLAEQFERQAKDCEAVLASLDAESI